MLKSRQRPVGHCHEQFPHVGINCEHCIVNMWKKYKVKITKIKLWKVFLDFRHYRFSVRIISYQCTVISLPLPFVSYSLWDNTLIRKVKKKGMYKKSVVTKSFRNTIRVSNSLDPDQTRRFVGLIWVQTVCKGYQLMTKVTTSRERVKALSRIVADDILFILIIFQRK